ncbi:MAG: sodium:solute symporter [Bacillota bacterium]|nr:sodium:solute symporter [Bacillota bacterium]MDW7682824.1 sodium:solute symporter [Bacillota bacterium]
MQEVTWAIDNTFLGLAVVILCFALFYFVGWWSQRKTTDVSDLYVAGRTIGSATNGLGMASTWASLATFMGVTSLILALQVPFVYLWIQWILSIPLITLLYGTSLRRMQAYTPATFIRERYGNTATVIVACWMILIMLMYALGQMIGLAKAFEMLFGFPYVTALFIGGLIIVGYVTIGGMYGASYNAAFQMVIMTLAFIVPLGAIMKQMGSTGWWFPPLAYGDMVQSMIAAVPTFFDPTYSFKWYFALIPAFTLGPIGLPHLAMRVFTAPSLKSARWAVVWFSVFLGLLFSATYTMGFAGNFFTATTGTVISPADADKITMILNVYYNPEWVTAIVIAGAIAAGLSTLNGNLLAIGALTAQDILGIFRPDMDDKKKMNIGYAVLFIAGVLSVILAYSPPQFLVTSILWAFGICGSAVTPMILLGVWWKEANKLAGMISSIVCGFLFIIVSPYVMPNIVLGEGLTANLGMSGALFTVPLAFALFIFLSLLFNRIPSLEGFNPTEKDKRFVDRIHGWPDYDESRYAGNGWAALVGVVCIFISIWGLMPW